MSAVSYSPRGSEGPGRCHLQGLPAPSQIPVFLEILQNCLKFFLAVLGNEKGHGLDGMDFFAESIETALTIPDLVTFVAAVETFFFTAFGIRAHPVRGAFRI